MQDLARSLDELRVRVLPENEIKDFVLDDPSREAIKVKIPCEI